MSDSTIPLRARLRSGAALALAGHVITNGFLEKSTRTARWNLTVRAPSVWSTLCVDDHGTTVVHGPRRDGGPGVTLRFLSDTACLALFSGGSSTPIPIPRTLRPGRILSAFKAASTRVRNVLSNVNDSDVDEATKRDQAHLLLRATAEGICTVGNDDASVVAWAKRVEPGTILIAVDGDAEMAVTIASRDGALGVVSRHAESSAVPAEAPRARLRFASVDVAHAILSGSEKAGNAVANGDLTLRGRIPMIRNLFPLLDRLGELMRMEAPQ